MYIHTDTVSVSFDPQQYTVTEGVDASVTVCIGLDIPLQRDGVRVQVATRDSSAQSRPSSFLFYHLLLQYSTRIHNYFAILNFIIVLYFCVYVHICSWYTNNNNYRESSLVKSPHTN